MTSAIRRGDTPRSAEIAGKATLSAESSEHRKAPSALTAMTERDPGLMPLDGRQLTGGDGDDVEESLRSGSGGTGRHEAVRARGWSVRAHRQRGRPALRLPGVLPPRGGEARGRG